MNKLSIERLKEMRVEAEKHDYTGIVLALDELIAIRELKGDQVPVGYIHGHQLTDLKDGNTTIVKPNAAFGETVELFTAPQNPVVLLNKITQADAPEVAEISTQVERLGLKGAYGAYAAGWNAAIEAADGKVASDHSGDGDDKVGK